MSDQREGLSIVGVGIAACAACSAPPVIALLAGSGAVALGGVMFGLLGVAVVAAASLGWVVIRRHRRRAGPGGEAQPVSVPAPTRRPR